MHSKCFCLHMMDDRHIPITWPTITHSVLRPSVAVWSCSTRHLGEMCDRFVTSHLMRLRRIFRLLNQFKLWIYLVSKYNSNSWRSLEVVLSAFESRVGYLLSVYVDNFHLLRSVMLLFISTLTTSIGIRIKFQTLASPSHPPTFSPSWRQH